jgi:hypothetical protein
VKYHPSELANSHFQSHFLVLGKCLVRRSERWGVRKVNMENVDTGGKWVAFVEIGEEY